MLGKYSMAVLAMMTISAQAVASTVKVWLSEDQSINSRLFLQSVDDPQNPGRVTSEGYLQGLFSLNYDAKVSDSVEFLADSPIVWAQVAPTRTSEFLLQEGRMHFALPTAWEIAGTISLQAFDVEITKGSAGFSVCTGDLAGAIGNGPVSRGFISYPNRNSIASSEVGAFYWPHAIGKCLVASGNDVAWNFSLNQTATISKFAVPSRQGCQLAIEPSTGISVSSTSITFPEHRPSSQLPVFKYWFTADDNTQGYEFSVDRMTHRDNALVLHDPSTDSCMCLSLSEPTGRLADSCYECACN